MSAQNSPTAPIRWTPARRRGLQAFAANNGRVRESNVTDVARGLVYWQVIAWMRAERLIDCVPAPPQYELTDAGRALLEATR